MIVSFSPVTAQTSWPLEARQSRCCYTSAKHSHCSACTFLKCLKSNSNALLLQAKSPIVEELQDHMTGLQQHRGQVAVDNSRGNDLEEMAPAEAAVQAALGVLSRYTATFAGTEPFRRSQN